jgi:hypothetical protein
MWFADAADELFSGRDDDSASICEEGLMGIHGTKVRTA